MTLKYADRVLETSTSMGTGDINLNGAPTGFQTFVQGAGDGEKVPYCIQDENNFETGIGTVTAGSPDTLSRDVILESSAGGSPVNWGPGTRNVFLGASSHLQVWRDENLNDTSGVAASGGTANAHTVTLSPAPLALSDKMIITWKAPANNTGNITVNVNGLGAEPYVNNDGAEFSSGAIVSGSIQQAAYDAVNGRFVRTTQLISIGTNTGDVVQLVDVGGNPGLPAVDGSQLTGVAPKVWSGQSTTVSTTSSSSWVNTPIAVTVTLSDPSHGVSLDAMINAIGDSTSTNAPDFRIVRSTSTAVSPVGNAAGNREQATATALPSAVSNTAADNIYISAIDFPGTAGPHTYTVQWKISGGTGRINRTGNDTDASTYSRTASMIKATEVKAP